LAKRHWSREFEPRGERNCRIYIPRVPPTLKDRFTAKCRREGNISQRNLLLAWIRNWTEGRRPDEDPPPQPEKTVKT
jgi:hypothetical protein